MNKNLPRVFANPINKELKNNKDVFYGDTKENRTLKDENIPRKINEIFASMNHVYKSRVHIITNTDQFDTFIVGKTGNYLLTLSGEKININNIVSIDKMWTNVLGYLTCIIKYAKIDITSLC